MAAIGDPVRTYDIPDPEEIPDEIPEDDPEHAGRPEREPSIPVPA